MKKENTKSEGQEVSVVEMGSVPDMLSSLQKQLKDVRTKTDDGISLDVDYNGVRISRVTKVKELIEIGASAKAVSEAYNKYRKQNGMEDLVVEWTHSDKTAEEWDAIIRKAITLIVNESKEAQLESAISQLEECLDAETKKQMKIKAILEASQNKIQ